MADNTLRWAIIAIAGLVIFLFNLYVSFPFLEIFIILANIKACFCFPCIHANLTEAFGFMATEAFYYLATTMI